MKILYDFKCEICDHIEEALVSSDIKEIRCEICGHFSYRTISTPRIQLDGTDPGFPTAWDKWARQHEIAGKEKP